MPGPDQNCTDGPEIYERNIYVAIVKLKQYQYIKVTNDKLIFENHIRAGQEKIGSAVVGEQIQIRISCSYNLTIQLKETYKISQE